MVVTLDKKLEDKGSSEKDGMLFDYVERSEKKRIVQKYLKVLGRKFFFT